MLGNGGVGIVEGELANNIDTAFFTNGDAVVAGELEVQKIQILDGLAFELNFLSESVEANIVTDDVLELPTLLGSFGIGVFVFRDCLWGPSHSLSSAGL